MNSKIKLICTYHKKDTLIKNDLIVPIHSGRALKAAKDRDWLIKNMIGDDAGENISNKNLSFGEYDVLFWVWKNYDKVDNPDYIGFMQYRRHFIFTPLGNKKINAKTGLVHFKKIDEKHLTNCGIYKENIYRAIDGLDLICHHRTPVVKGENVYGQYKFYHDIKDYDIAMNILKQRHPDFAQAACHYNESGMGYYHSCFIMKKDLYFSFCEWLFDILFELEKSIDISKDPYQKRTIAFIAERLLGIFYTKMQENKNFKYHELPIAFIDDKNVFQKAVRKVRGIR